MEDFESSPTREFQFKHIPKKEFEEMLTRIRTERKTKNTGLWGSFCSVTSGNDDNDSIVVKTKRKSKIVKAATMLTDEEVRSFIISLDKKGGACRNNKPIEAPFFGPARRLNVEALEKEQENSKPSTSTSDASTVPSIHINEVVHVYPQTSDIKIQVQNHDDDEFSDESTIGKKSLKSEIHSLCSEIENANRVAASGGDDSSIDLTYREEKTLQSIIDKTEEKVICEKYNKFIDKKFDFLFDECEKFGEDEEKAVQALPVVELKEKSAKNKKLLPDGDFPNDNNVWIPQTENQIRKSGKRQESETTGARKKKNDEVFPSDVIIRKASEVGKLKRDANEKSQGCEASTSKKADEKKRTVMDEDLQSRVDIINALGKVSELQSNICKYLDFVREIIVDPPEIEDIEDLKKRQQRATEFSNRFARNHLYQIGRIAEEISVMPDNPADVASKVIQLFQIIMQSVQIYLKNVEMFIYNRHPDKLSILINFIINSVTICLERHIFDKRDAAVQQLLRKCLDMKKYLEMNQQSLTKFASMKEQKKFSMHARNSFAFENNYRKKLSMYEPQLTGIPLKPRKPKLPAKSPYEPLIPRNLKSSYTNVNPKQKFPLNRNQSQTPLRVKSPMLRKSSSNVSTAMQRMKDSESNEIIKTVSEQPFEENTSAAPRREKEMEIMEMMQNIAKEKFNELLVPFLNELKKNLPIDKPKHELSVEKETRPISPSPRVTSEIEMPQKEKLSPNEEPKSFEKVQNVSKNVQYLYVKSNEEEKKTKAPQSKLQPSASKTQVVKLNSEITSTNSQQKPKKAANVSETKIVSSTAKPPIQVNKNFDEPEMKQMKEQVVKQRIKHAEQMMKNPHYTEKAYDEPWKMFAGISEKLVDEMLQSVVNDLDFGEKTFIENFLRHELNC